VDDLALIGLSLQAASEVTQQIGELALKIGLAINVDKTKYMNTSRTRQQNSGTRVMDIIGKVYQEVTYL
jgi:hypothetical protein